jgi:ribosomal protein S12 methylthiotransferase
METQKKISAKNNALYVGSVQRVIIDSEEDEFFIGRGTMDAPEVDCEVIIDREDHDLVPGDMVNVLIYDSAEYDLFGKIERN